MERIEGEASPHRFGCRSSWPWSWLHVVRTESSDSHPSDSLRISCADHSPRPNPSTWVFPQLTFQWFYGEAMKGSLPREEQASSHDVGARNETHWSKTKTQIATNLAPPWGNSLTFILNPYFCFSLYLFWWKGEIPRAEMEGKAKTQKWGTCKLWKGHWSKVQQV